MQPEKDCDLKNKKVSIIGLGKSGIAAARLLFKLGADIWISEYKDNENTRLSAKSLKDLEGIHIEIGRHSEEFIKNSELVVVSPGVKEEAKPIAWAVKANIPVISEIELGFLFCPAKIIAVTGSNGKTTTVTLIANLLNAYGFKAYALGNIGESFSDKVLNLSASDIVVLEVSTFQLEQVKNFKADIAVLLNIGRNHLDRHKDMQTYINLKKRIFLNQTNNDFAVLNKDDITVSSCAEELKSQILYFGKNDFNIDEEAAVEVVSLFGIKKKQCAEVFKNFKGVEHRLEYVDTINSIEFINDSKSTTVDATIWALSNIKKPIILIAGGRDKGADFRQLRPFVKGRLKKVILLGEARDLIADALSDLVLTVCVDSLSQAVETAFKSAEKGDCILLSAMCTSFDMFANFEERGRTFKEIVMQKIRAIANINAKSA